MEFESIAHAIAHVADQQGMHEHDVVDFVDLFPRAWRRRVAGATVFDVNKARQINTKWMWDIRTRASKLKVG